MTYKKKLIEVALPLEAINVASAREKSIRHGHPSTLHLWWARRPLAAARAVIFAQMVDDPSEHPDIFRTEKAQEKERQRLFRIIEDLVKWESTTDEAVLQKARDEIWQSWRYTCAENSDHPLAKDLFDRFTLPGFHDPFAGGGALPLEAQRLGLASHASDLNPVAVLINKAMIEILPRFDGDSPVNPESHQQKIQMDKRWTVLSGFADDLQYYGRLLRDQVENRIGQLYPKYEINSEIAVDRPDLQPYVGQKLVVIAWLWARTVKSPNPAFAQVDVPLTSTFLLSTKPGKGAYIEPVIGNSSYRFEVKIGKPIDAAAVKSGTKLSRGSFKCLFSDVPITYSYIDGEANAGRMGARLMAVVAEGVQGRVFLPPNEIMESTALSAQPTWKPETPSRGTWASNAQGRVYGFKTFGDYFTKRQLIALTTFSDLITDIREQVCSDAILNMKSIAFEFENGREELASAYADAICVYLAFAVSKLADRGSTICGWDSSRDSLRNTFGRQAIPMTWDYAEANPFSSSTGSYDNAIAQGVKVIGSYTSALFKGVAVQDDAAVQSISVGKVISTDPPYYDNIGYGDLSDFFYVWLRRSLKSIFPELFLTLSVPKAEELIACTYRHGDKKNAAIFFLDGMTHAMHRLADQSHPAFPVTIYYAFKQAESDNEDGTVNTGWDTFLAAVIDAGFSITGTWPMRTELGNKLIGNDANMLASSIVLVCRHRSADDPVATYREFISALKTELPLALSHLQAGNIAPVDLAQAAIGPGMAVFTRYVKVLDADGQRISVRTALALINQTLDETLAEQEGEFDSDTRWAVTWFDQVGFAEGDFGIATVLAQAKATGVNRLVEAGIIVSGKGKVRLLQPSELQINWDPIGDNRLTVWEVVHQLVRALELGGETAASKLVANLGEKAEIARELCYRLYALCERKKRSVEAMAYNGLVQSWPEINRLASASPPVSIPVTVEMFK